MTWVKVCERRPEDPRFVAMGEWADDAFVLDVYATAWCNRQLADGRLPKGNVAKLTTFSGKKIRGVAVTPDKVVGLLLRHGLWEDRGDHYYLADFFPAQPSRDDVLRKQEDARARMRRVRGSRSQDVRANTSRTAGEPGANDAGSSPNSGSESESGSLGGSPAASGSGSVARARTDSDAGRSESPPGWAGDMTPDLEAELQQRFVDGFVPNPAAEWALFVAWYRKHPPGPGANWSVLVDAWIRGIAEKGAAGEQPRRRGPRAVHDLVASIGKPLDDPEAVRKAELGAQAERLRVGEGGRR